MLLHDLRLKERRNRLKEIIKHVFPITLQDVVLIFITIIGKINNRLVQKTWIRKLYGQKIEDRFWSTIQMITAFSICAMLDLLDEDRLPQKAVVRQKETHFKNFINT